MQQTTNTAVLGTEKISKLLMQYALPSIIAMTASILYNIIDSIFIGHIVGPMAISALAISMPLMTITAAFGALIGSGAASLLSIKLGQNDHKSAMEILGNVILLNVIIGTVLGLLGIIFLDEILYAFQASEATIGYARDFMRIILLGNVFTHLYLGLNNVLRASGYPKMSMTVMLIAVGTNIVLVVLFVVILGWGISGAALATVLAQFGAMMIQLRHFMDKKQFIRIERAYLKLKTPIIKGILSIGMAPFFMNLCSSIVILFINTALQKNGGDIAIGAYGIVSRFVMIFIMTVMGLNQGMQPIVGYNYGARHFGRVKRAFWLTVIVATCVTTVGFVIGMFLPKYVGRVFVTDQALIDAAARALRIICITFPLIGFQMVSSTFFQAIGKAPKAILLSLTRQMLFLLPLLIFLPDMWGTDGVWWSMPIADFFSVLLAVFLIVKQARMFDKQTLNQTL